MFKPGVVFITALIHATTGVTSPPDQFLPGAWKKGSCLKEIDMPNFQQEKIFKNGVYYMRNTYNDYLNLEKFTCSGVNFTNIPGVVNFNYWYAGKLNLNSIISGSVDRKTFNGSSYIGKFEALLGSTNKQLPYTILDTDYDNFNIVYSCQQTGEFKLESCWIMTKSREGNQFHEAFDKALMKIGLKLSNLIAVQVCPKSSGGGLLN